jgi:glycosyltransferase involved in cell wall biosynthesis
VNLSINHLRSSIGLYGAEQVILELCKHQLITAPDTHLIVFTAARQAEPALLREAVRRELRAEGLRCAGRLDPNCILQLRRRLKERGKTGPVVLHCHDYKSVVYGGLASVGLPVARIATMHGWLEGSGRLRLYHWLESRMLRHFERVCAVSPVILNHLLEKGLEPTRVRRVNNGIDTNRYRPGKGNSQGARRSVLRIGTAARLSPEKNLGLLIRALEACRQRGLKLELDIVGDGPQRDELEKLTEHMGLKQQVRFSGCIEQLEDWYPTLDAFVLPSLSEGMPISILEALACGCPVIATNVGAIHELLDGIPGCKVVAINDLDALTNALMALPWTHTPLLEASDRINCHYSGAHMASRYAGIYREAVTT